jgi:hypothetical protein
MHDNLFVPAVFCSSSPPHHPGVVGLLIVVRGPNGASNEPKKRAFFTYAWGVLFLSKLFTAAF